ncbi:MAG: diguanylate cyclase [Sulfurimonas sp.]|nr:diguanylate cyclase [Sulfurimonas sp.]
MYSTYSNKLKNRYLLLIGFIFFLALISRGYYDVKHHRSMINSQMQELHNNTLLQYKNLISNLEEKYTSVGFAFTNMQDIYEPIKQRDRELLYSKLEKNYLKLQEFNSNLHIMHLHDTLNISILRMHKPASYDDDLTDIRPIIKQTNIDKKVHFGFETGKNGINYRISLPFITRDDEHLGVIEFGIKPQYFASCMSSLLGAEAQVLVKTSSLEHLQTQTDYEELGEFSIISKNYFFNKLKESIELDKQSQIVEIGDRTYILFNDLCLDDYKGEMLAKILIAKDITQKVIENRDSIILVNILNFLILLVCFILIYIIFTKYSSSLKKAHSNISKLEVEVETDTLTGINNRASLNNFLQKRVTISNEYALIFFDIDHFKKINDTYGHDTGDAILKELTSIIKKDLRVDDLFARWGGEEFAIVLRSRNLENAVKITQKIKEKICSNLFCKNIKLTCSFGVTMIDKPHKMNEVFKRADELLYEAKDAGRDCIRYA